MIADLEQVRSMIDKAFSRRGARATAGRWDEAQSSPCATGEATESVAGLSLDVGGIVGSAMKLSSDWCFVDSCTAERFFRVDRAQEHLHYLTDIANESLYVLDQDSPTMPSTPEDEIVVQNALLQHQQMQLPTISPSESR